MERRTYNTMTKIKKYKKRSAKHTHKTKDRTPLTAGVNTGASEG